MRPQGEQRKKYSFQQTFSLRGPHDPATTTRTTCANSMNRLSKRTYLSSHLECNPTKRPFQETRLGNKERLGASAGDLQTLPLGLVSNQSVCSRSRSPQ